MDCTVTCLDCCLDHSDFEYFPCVKYPFGTSRKLRKVQEHFDSGDCGPRILSHRALNDDTSLAMARKGKTAANPCGSARRNPDLSGNLSTQVWDNPCLSRSQQSGYRGSVECHGSGEGE